MLPGADGLAPLGEAQATNLARCAELARSQASLQSASSVGSARGDEGAGYADVYGDYHPLFNNLQDPDNVSLQGGGQPGRAGGVPGGGWGRGGRLSLAPPCAEAEAEAEALARAGQGGRKLEGWWLKVRQFHGLLVKRFHCARRNSKALSSQILLPALFVCVAMTVALSVPEIGTLLSRQRASAGGPPGGTVACPPPSTWGTHPLRQGLALGLSLAGARGIPASLHPGPART